MIDYKILVNGVDEFDFSTHHTEYQLAVLSAFGCLGLSYPCEVEIWVPHLLPDYGPYKYRIADFVDVDGREYQAPAVTVAK